MWCVQKVPEGGSTGGRVWAGGCPPGFAQGAKHGECIGALAATLYMRAHQSHGCMVAMRVRKTVPDINRSAVKPGAQHCRGAEP